MHQIRSLGPSLDEVHCAIEQALISLPVRLGGFGIPSYAKCAPHTYAAANELADTVLAPILPSIQPTSEPMLSQSERCQDMFEAAHSSTFELLDSHKLVLESSSSLGRKWMSVLPTAAQFRLTDSEVAGALQQRTPCESETWNTAAAVSGRGIWPRRGLPTRWLDAPPP